ncbi:MAG: aldehyde dehydrogenase family protein [Phycisphaeraceae bacterium]|nr:aldehyde dehydrogenase family protein [Phycisphaeraceae bacterium]
MTRLEVAKTYKLFINGKFPRSESGRTTPVATSDGHAEPTVVHVCRASRKDLRDAVTAARKAQEPWAGATAYLRGQIFYRMAEMLEGHRALFESLIAGARPKPTAAHRTAARVEVAATIERLVAFAGWADKYAQVLGCNNPVAGPYYNFTTPEPTGVVGVIAPDEPSLLGLITLIAPPLCAGNAVVALAAEANPLPAAVLGEVLATSDLPGGVVNLLTGSRDELIPVFASHRDVDSLVGAGLSPAHAATLREGAAENVKRVVILGAPAPAARKSSSKPPAIDWHDTTAWESPWSIEPFVEFKTVWHPSGA